jgi:hypothetical protein
VSPQERNDIAGTLTGWRYANNVGNIVRRHGAALACLEFSHHLGFGFTCNLAL